LFSLLRSIHRDRSRPALLDEAHRLKLELDPLDGAALQAAITGTSVAPEVVARAAASPSDNQPLSFSVTRKRAANRPNTALPALPVKRR